MNGNDDFFGGSVNPAPVPHPGTGLKTNVYASPSSPGTPVKTASSPVVSVILVVVVTLLVVATFLGYRGMTSGTEIVLPDELLGMERVNPDSKTAQDVQRSWSELDNYVGGDIELHVGTYARGTELLIVAAAEAGVGGKAEQDDYFSGFSSGFADAMPQAKFTELDAGSHGGRMQCVNIGASGNFTGACTWITEDTFGVVVLTSPGFDVAGAARMVRSAIEQ